MAKKMRPQSRQKDIEPAKVNYWFGPGWKQFGAFLSGMWKAERDSVRICYYKYLSASIFTFRGIFWLIASLFDVIFGSIYTALISVAFSAVLSVFYLFFYLGFSVIWLADRFYLQRNKIFTACPNCKSKSLIPVYACPSCQAKHRNLVPGKYGIFYHTCNCGQKLGSTFFTGRKNLQAYCPVCGAALADRENVPLCIPIIGGRSVGKTAFITAFATSFLDEVAPEHNWTTEFYNPEKEKLYDEIRQDYRQGTTRMTQIPSDITQASAISFSFFLSGDDLKPERLVHIYDIAGEVFTQNTETETQRQYEYCQGMVLLLDPFSIPMVRAKYEDSMVAEDVAGIGSADMESIMDSFLNKLREVTGLSDEQMYQTPIAVVINKIDSAGLMRELGPSAVKQVQNHFADRNVSEMDAEDYVCREFLKEYDMADFVNQIEMHFRNNRYFACSAIGHARDHGRYRPTGVTEPMEWLFGQADHSIRVKWNDHTFGKVPLMDK